MWQEGSISDQWQNECRFQETEATLSDESILVTNARHWRQDNRPSQRVVTFGKGRPLGSNLAGSDPNQVAQQVLGIAAALPYPSIIAMSPSSLAKTRNLCMRSRPAKPVAGRPEVKLSGRPSWVASGFQFQTRRSDAGGCGKAYSCSAP